MRTARSLTVSRSIRGSGSAQHPLDADPPPNTHWIQTPLDADLPWMQTLPLDADLHPVNRMTDTCKNITFPQTSIAGANKQ